MAMWYATKEELRCFCARTHGVVWTLEDPPIMKCDGRELALLQMQADNA
jgi:DNA polymerase V